MLNLGTGPFGEATLIRFLVRLGAEPHSPVASSDKSKGASAVVALVRGHCLLLHSATKQVGCGPLVPDHRELETRQVWSILYRFHGGTGRALIVTKGAVARQRSSEPNLLICTHRGDTREGLLLPLMALRHE